MKIVIKDNDPIRIYHHPREVRVHPKSKIVSTLKSDGTLLETFKLVDKSLSWCDNPDNDQSEILVTLQVEKTIKKEILFSFYFII